MWSIKWFRSSEKSSGLLREVHAGSDDPVAQFFYNSFTPRSHSPARVMLNVIYEPGFTAWFGFTHQLEVIMRSLTKLCLLLILPAALPAGGQLPLSTNAPAASPGSDLLLREIRYDGRLGDDEAKFMVDIDAECSGRDGASVTLFEGEVAVMPAKLPAGLRVVREGKQYRLVAARAGRYRFKLEVIARITRAEPWNQVSFVGPDTGIASVVAEAGNPDVEVQLLSGTTLEPAQGG